MKALFSLAAIALCAAPCTPPAPIRRRRRKFPTDRTLPLPRWSPRRRPSSSSMSRSMPTPPAIKLEEDAQLKGDKLTAEQKKTIEAQQAQKNNAGGR